MVVPCCQVQAYCLAHKGKATSDVTFNMQDPPEAYNNASVLSRLSGYTSMAQEVHGPKFDPINEPIDGEVVMRAGGGKKHGRYWFGDSLVDTATIPLSRRFEPGVPAQALPYAHGQTLHRLRLRLSRLFLFHPSFLRFYICSL